MKWAITLLACALISLALFSAYRIGLKQGRIDGTRIALAVAEGARYEATTKIGSIVGNPNLWEGMSREQFQERMTGDSQKHFTSLQGAMLPLQEWQREAVIAALWESLGDEDEMRLREIPLPSDGN